MSAPLPDAFRPRFQRLIEDGVSGRAPALRLKLDPHRSFLVGLIEQDGDMTLPETAAGALADATGVQAHPDAIGRFLRKPGFPCKKKTQAATERRRARVRKQRNDWFTCRLPSVPARPDRVVLLMRRRSKQT